MRPKTGLAELSPTAPSGWNNLEWRRKYQREYARTYRLTHKDKVRATARRAYAKEKASGKPAKWRLEQRFKRYGLTLETATDLMNRQGNKCPVCGDALELKRTHVDHNHSTGKARGILCNLCNGGLGLFQESIERLRGAIRYIELHK